jgi:MoxR-like ATPase
MKGIHVFIAGPQGCGKTQLIQLIADAIMSYGEYEYAFAPTIRIECGETTAGPIDADIVIREIQIDADASRFLAAFDQIREHVRNIKRELKE